MVEVVVMVQSGDQSVLGCIACGIGAGNDADDNADAGLLESNAMRLGGLAIIDFAIAVLREARSSE